MHHFIGQISKDGERFQISVIHGARRVVMMSAGTKDLNFLGRGSCRIAGMTVSIFRKHDAIFSNMTCTLVNAKQKGRRITFKNDLGDDSRGKNRSDIDKDS